MKVFYLILLARELNKGLATAQDAVKGDARQEIADMQSSLEKLEETLVKAFV